jgi:hypothetical protein
LRVCTTKALVELSVPTKSKHAQALKDQPTCSDAIDIALRGMTNLGQRVTRKSFSLDTKLRGGIFLPAKGMTSLGEKEVVWTSKKSGRKN